MGSHQCHVCGQAKPLEEFNTRPNGRKRTGPQRPRGKCKTCERAYLKEWKSRRIAAGLPTRDTDKEKAAQRERYQNDPVYREQLCEKNRLRRRQEPALAAQRKNEAERRKNDPSYKMGKTLRARLRAALKGIAKSTTTMKLLGCSAERFLAHLESLWKPGMSWETYGLKGWHVDHVIPCAAFDLTNPEEQARCFHWTNMQPMWAVDNIRKHDWVPDYQI